VALIWNWIEQKQENSSKLEIINLYEKKGMLKYAFIWQGGKKKEKEEEKVQR